MRDWFSIERATADLQGRKHSVELQSVRGLASLTVVLLHCCYYYDSAPALRRMCEIAINAHAAVVTFFVLSGFVLTISMSRRPIDMSEVVTFYIRRVFRIYPALWVALFLSVAYALIFRGTPKPDVVSAWWDPQSRVLPSVPVAVLSIIGVFTPLAVPIWSLFVELVASILMPGIAWLLFRRTRVFLIVMLLLTALSQVGGISIFVAPTYLIDFALGASIVLVTPAIARPLRKNGVAIGAAMAAFVVLWFGRNLVAGDFMTDYASRPAALLEAIGATALIAVLYVRADLFSFLRSRALIWLGDVSYSLYLLHLPILALVAGVGGELLGIWPLAAGGVAGMLMLIFVTLIVALGASALSYRFVEVPMIRVGKRVVIACRAPISAMGRLGRRGPGLEVR